MGAPRPVVGQQLNEGEDVDDDGEEAGWYDADDDQDGCEMDKAEDERSRWRRCMSWRRGGDDGEVAADAGGGGGRW